MLRLLMHHSRVNPWLACFLKSQIHRMKPRNGSRRWKSFSHFQKMKEGDSRTCLPRLWLQLCDSLGRGSIIRKLIEKEEQYVHDLEIVEIIFITPLRSANLLVISSDDIDQFIEDVFLNILELRECNRRLLENMYVRQREQAPVIQRIGDVLLEAATEFRESYAQYVGRRPIADKKLKDELERNPDFRLFIEVSRSYIRISSDVD
jgi:hypothetical protein